MERIVHMSADLKISVYCVLEEDGQAVREELLAAIWGMFQGDDDGSYTCSSNGTDMSPRIVVIRCKLFCTQGPAEVINRLMDYIEENFPDYLRELTILLSPKMFRAEFVC